MLEIFSALISIYIVHLSRYKVLILPCEVVSLVIGIGQGLLARWQKSTFGLSSDLMTKGWHQQAIGISQVLARWLEVLASYAGRPNLTVIMSGTVLERLRTWRVTLKPKDSAWLRLGYEISKGYLQYVISIGQSADQMTKASHQNKPEFEPGDNKEYEVEAIWDSAVYAKEQTDTFQSYTIWLYRRVTRKKKTPENLLRPSCTSERWSAPSIGTTRRSRQQHQHPWTPLRPWPSQRSSFSRSKSEGDRHNARRSVLNEATRKRQQGRGDKKEATRKRQQGGIWVNVVLEPEAGG